jgi:hypothetical protein
VKNLERVLSLAEGKTVHSAFYDPDLSQCEPCRSITLFFTDGTALRIDENGSSFEACWQDD